MPIQKAHLPFFASAWSRVWSADTVLALMRGFATVIVCALPLGILFCVSFDLVRYEHLWTWNTATLPPLTAVVTLALYLLSWTLLPYGHRRFLHIQGVLILALIYITSHGPHLGDNWAYNIQATDYGTPKSSILAIWFSIWFAKLGLSQDYLSPLAGCVSGFVAFKIIDELSKDADGAINAKKAVLGQILYIGSAFHLLFFTGYREMSQLASPFLLAAFYFGIRSLRTDDGQTRRMIGFFSFFLAMAALVHGGNTFFLPLIPLLPLIHRVSKNEFRHVSADLSHALKIGLVTALCMCGALALTGYQLDTGDMYGGGDGRFFVAFVGPLQGFDTFYAFSPEHFYELGNIFLLAAPLALVLAVLFLWRKSVLSMLKDDTTFLFLTLASLGYCAFVFLFNFDLGYPADYDLMFSMCTPLLLTTIYAAMHYLRPRLAYGLGLAGIVYIWMFMAQYLTRLPA